MTPKRKERKEWGILRFGIALFLLFFIGRIWEDAQGEAHLWLVSWSWLIIAVITYVLGSIYYAQFVSPLQGEEGWSEGVRLLFKAYFDQVDKWLQRPKPSIGVKTLPPDIDSLPASLKSLSAGFIKGHQVLAITKGSSYMRPVGPGFVVLYKGEQIWRVIDLRLQRRSQLVLAKTRDGISIETSVTVTFQVKQRPSSSHEPDLLYPFDRDAIFHVSYDDTVDEQGKLLPWTRQLTPPAAAILANEIPKHSLNELTNVVEGFTPLAEIKEMITRNITRRFASKGIKVIKVKIGRLKLPLSVRKQQFLTWRADWLRKIRVENASGNVEAVRRIKQAQARAQIEIIENITNSIDAMRQEEGAELPQVIMLRMIKVLEDTLSAGSLQAFVPQQLVAGMVRDASSQMRSLVEPSRIHPPSLDSGRLGTGSESAEEEA